MQVPDLSRQEGQMADEGLSIPAGNESATCYAPQSVKPKSAARSSAAAVPTAGPSRMLMGLEIRSWK